MARGNGKADAVISAAVAEEFQNSARSEGSQLIWQIALERGEHAGKYVARPILVRGGRPRPMAYLIVADTLEGVQDSLPSGLQRVRCDDPLIVENWIER